MKMYDNEFERIIEQKIKPELNNIYELRIKGLEDRHIAKYLGITLKHFHRAIEEYPDLHDAYNDATLLFCSDLRSVVADRALGRDGKRDKDGNPVGPDANLAFKLLEKLDPEFSSRQTLDVNVKTVEDVIRAIKKEDVKVIDHEEDEGGHVS